MKELGVKENITIKEFIFTLKILSGLTERQKYALVPRMCVWNNREIICGGTHDEDWNITEYIWD